MNLRCSRCRERYAAYMLVECLVYIMVSFILTGVAYVEFAQGKQSISNGGPRLIP